MQSNTPKADGSQRERPLQKSMFLSDFQHQPIIPSRPQPLQNIHYNPLKRSSMPVLQGIHQSNLSPSYHNHNISYSQSPSSPVYMPIQFNQMRAQSQHELLLPNNTINNIKSINNMARTDITNDLQTRGFSKFEKSLGFEVKSPTFAPIQSNESKQLINTIIEQLKQKYLPSILKTIKQQLTDEILNLKNEFQILKLQIKNKQQKQQIFNNDIKNQTGNIINFNTNNINNINKIKKQQYDIKQLQKQFYLLERKYNQIQVKLSQNLTNLYNQFQKITLKLQRQSKQKIYKISQIKSSLTPIMLEYKQSFIIKRSDLPQRINQQEIIIGTCQYYIDKNGYLLDNQNKYLIDLKGHQIKLQQKHIKLLEQYKILHR